MEFAACELKVRKVVMLEGECRRSLKVDCEGGRQRSMQRKKGIADEERRKRRENSNLIPKT